MALLSFKVELSGSQPLRPVTPAATIIIQKKSTNLQSYIEEIFLQFSVLLKRHTWTFQETFFIYVLAELDEKVDKLFCLILM